MGERVLLARRVSAGGYDRYRRHWAESARLVAAASRGRCPDPSGGERWQECGRTNWSALIDEFDYLTHALCLRCESDSVRSYLPVWLGIPAGESDRIPPTCGVLLRVGSRSEFSRLRARVRRQKERLGRAIERGEITTTEAQQCLLASVDDHERSLSASARDRR